MFKKISFSLLIAIFGFALPSKAQIPSGGNNIISPVVENHYFYNGEEIGEVTEVSVSGQPFSKAIKVKTTGFPIDSWGTQLQFTEIGGLNTDDVVLVVFWGRVTQSIQETGEGFVNVVIENNSTYDKQITQTVSLTNEWKEYYTPFIVTETLAQNQLGSAFHLGYGNQTIEIAQVQIINYQNSRTIEELPKTKVTYAGSEENAPWRIEAANRIEQYRKGDIQVTITDNIGLKIEGANVTITMLDHEFGFGSAIGAQDFLDNEQFRDTALALFNEFTIENALKWQSYQWSNVKTRARNTVDLMKSYDKRIRGHVLVWPSFRYNPEYLKDYQNNPIQLRTEINNHITELVTEFEGDLLDWDVMNEPYTNYEFMDILGYEEMSSWFKQTRAIDSKAKLFINDYSILSAGGLDVNHQDAYYNTIERIDNEGGNIEGVGMQGHFSTQLTPITKIYSILDQFSSLNKSIKITEFDIDLTDQDIQHDYTRDFMTIVFSHPSVDAFIMWGFWAGKHWKPDAALYNLDWTPRKHLYAYKDLVFKEWWTPTVTATSDDFGQVTTRGFLGKYEIRSEFENEIIIDTVQVSNNSSNNEFAIKHNVTITGNQNGLSNLQVLYPNPTSGIIKFNNELDFTLITSQGHLVEQSKNTFVDLSERISGVYFLIIDEVHYKVVKQ